MMNDGVKKLHALKPRGNGDCGGFLTVLVLFGQGVIFMLGVDASRAGTVAFRKRAVTANCGGFFPKLHCRC